MNHSPNTFKYSNKQYSLAITLWSQQEDGTSTLTTGLDGGDVESFEYSTKLNSLLVEGKIVYFDQYAFIDKFLSQNICYCYVQFAEHLHAKPGKEGMGNLDPDRTFEHTFIVRSIKPLDRQQNRIKYEIDIVSENWFRCAANVRYSNYDRGRETILDILKNCLAQNGLNIDKDSFDVGRTNVAINYISKLNDTVFTTMRFLLHQLYYMPQKDTSVKFLYYDIFSNMYKILDLKNKNSADGAFSTTLSMFKTNTEALVQQEPTNLGAFLNPMGKTDVYSALFDKKMYGYSYEKNDFVGIDFGAKEKTNYLNNKIDNSDYVPKYGGLPQYQNLAFQRFESYWNSRKSFYDDSIEILEENDALILNTDGDIKRQAGTFTTINIDRSMANLTSDSKLELEKEKQKFKNYEGVWYNSKVLNIVCPSKSSFRQKVVLFRNYIQQQKRLV